MKGAAVPAGGRAPASGTALLAAAAAVHLARVQAAPLAAHAAGVPFASLLQHLQVHPHRTARSSVAGNYRLAGDAALNVTAAAICETGFDHADLR